MKFLKEFKEFAVKGNMMDMAVGIIIGAAFNKLVDVLVKKVLLPPLSLLVEGVNLGDKRIILRQEVVNNAEDVIIDEVSLGYGAFSEAFLDFLIVGFTIFIIVKFLNRIRTKSEDPKNKTISTPKDIELLTKLTNLMEEQNSLLKSKK